MLRRGLIAALVVLAVYGCDSTTVQVLQVGENRYEIKTDRGCAGSIESTLREVNRAADDVCAGRWYVRGVYGYESDCGNYRGARTVVTCETEEALDEE